MAAAAVAHSVSAVVDIDTIWSNEIAEFKKAMQKVRRKITSYDGAITWEFFGGVFRVQHVDVVHFYVNYLLSLLLKFGNSWN